MNMQKMKQAQLGIGTLDLAIWLVVVGVIILGVLFAKDQLTNAVDAKGESEYYLSMISAAQEGFGLAPNYGNLDVEWLVGSGAVPPEMVAAADEIRNGYNGLITIGPTGGGDRQILFTSEDIEQQDCQKIVNKLSREAVTMGTNASNTNIKANPGDQYDPVAVQAACTASDPVDINIVAN